MRRLSGMAHVLLGIALLTTGCAKFNLFKRNEAPVALAGPRVGSPAPDIEGEDFEGKRFKLSDYRGKVVVVSFWASECLPCLRLMPHEQALVQRYRDKNFVLLGVNLDNEREKAMQAMARHGVSWRNWQTGGPGNAIPGRYSVSSIPAIYVIDAKGIIRYACVGDAQVENIIDTLLAEAASKRN